MQRSTACEEGPAISPATLSVKASSVGAAALGRLRGVRGRLVRLRIGGDALVFRRSVDIILGNSLTAVTLGGLRSGFSMTLSAERPLSLAQALGDPKPGSTLTAFLKTSPPALMIGCGGRWLEVVLEGAEVWTPWCLSPQPPREAPAGYETLATRSAKLLAFMAAACGSCPSGSVLEAVSKAAALSRGGGAGDFVRSLTPYAGMGDGLTPACDDVILGASAACECLRRAGVADAGLPASLLEEVRRRTSRLSYLILLESLRGGVNEGLDTLVRGLLTGSWSDVSSGATDLLTLGGSSGVSMGLGAILAFSMHLSPDAPEAVLRAFRSACL